MTQYLIIGLLVLWAVLYSALSLMPSAWRRALAARLATWADRAGVGTNRAQALESSLRTTGSCTECAACNGCARTTRQADPTLDRF